MVRALSRIFKILGNRELPSKFTPWKAAALGQIAKIEAELADFWAEIRALVR
jgi:hypothetical protein